MNEVIKEGDLSMIAEPLNKLFGKNVHLVYRNGKYVAAITRQDDGEVRFHIHAHLDQADFVPFWLALGRLGEKIGE